MEPKFILRVDTFENDNKAPVLSHVFYGNTKDEAERILLAHMRFDSFLQASFTTKRFGDFRVHSTKTWIVR